MANTVPSVKVYCASCWWRDCDSFARIAGADASTVRKAIYQAMEDAAKDAADSDEERTTESLLDDILWSGVHSYDLRDLVADHEVRELDADDLAAIARGNKDAVLHLPTY